MCKRIRKSTEYTNNFTPNFYTKFPYYSLLHSLFDIFVTSNLIHTPWIICTQLVTALVDWHWGFCISSRGSTVTVVVTIKWDCPSIKSRVPPQPMVFASFFPHLTLQFYSSSVLHLLLLSSSLSTLSLPFISPHLHPKVSLHSDYPRRRDVVLSVSNLNMWLHPVSALIELDTHKAHAAPFRHILYRISQSPYESSSYFHCLQ